MGPGPKTNFKKTISSITKQDVMLKNLCFLFVALMFTSVAVNAQDDMSLDQLSAMKAEKEAVKAGIDAEIADIDKKIKSFPGWTKGLAGTVGMDFGGTNNWFADDVSKIGSSGFGLNVGGYANKNGDADKYFWHNTLNASVTSGVSRSDNNNNGSFEEEGGERVNTKASIFNIGSLAGYQLFDKVYASAEGLYETTLLNFNDPGKLTFSAGFTYKPINNLVIVVHPLAYQWTFPGGTYSSASGAKIGATYTGEIVPGVTWTSNLLAFMAYSGDDEKGYSSSQLSNWTWMNGFTVANVFKGVGLGFNLGLRKDEQLGLAKGSGDPGTIQSIYTLGLSYAL